MPRFDPTGALPGSSKVIPIPVIDANGGAYSDATRPYTDAYKHKDVIERVTFWGLSDRRTWRFGQHPLIFDGDNQRKPCYSSITDVLPVSSLIEIFHDISDVCLSVPCIVNGRGVDATTAGSRRSSRSCWAPTASGASTTLTNCG